MDTLEEINVVFYTHLHSNSRLTPYILIGKKTVLRERKHTRDTYLFLKRFIREPSKFST